MVFMVGHANWVREGALEEFVGAFLLALSLLSFLIAAWLRLIWPREPPPEKPAFRRVPPP